MLTWNEYPKFQPCFSPYSSMRVFSVFCWTAIVSAAPNPGEMRNHRNHLLLLRLLECLYGNGSTVLFIRTGSPPTTQSRTPSYDANQITNLEASAFGGCCYSAHFRCEIKSSCNRTAGCFFSCQLSDSRRIGCLIVVGLDTKQQQRIA